MTLYFTLDNRKEFDKVEKLLRKSTYFSDQFNTDFGYFGFDVEDQADADALEIKLTNLFNHNNIYGTFESVD